jgi:tetratricopeptide (TPR) repeat protein
MYKALLPIMAAFTLLSCSQSQESMLKQIADFEKSEKTGTKDGLAELAKMHKAYGLKYEDAEANNYLYAAAQYYYYENNTTEAESLLTQYITRDDSTERYRNAAINLATLYGKANKYAEADDLISELLDKDLPTAAQWQDVIKLYEDKLQAKSNVTPKDYERLTLARTAVGRFNEALASLDQAIKDFPQYEKRGDLMYRAGFIGWEYLKDTKVASAYYNRFLTEYPNDPKAAEVKIILNNGMLSMSDEDILTMLKGKQK